MLVREATANDPTVRLDMPAIYREIVDSAAASRPVYRQMLKMLWKRLNDTRVPLHTIKVCCLVSECLSFTSVCFPQACDLLKHLLMSRLQPTLLIDVKMRCVAKSLCAVIRGWLLG